MRILLVEDPAGAELVGHELCRGGVAHVLQRVEDRPGFLAALTAFQPDLIVANCDTTRLGGAEALELTRERCPEAPVILVGGEPSAGLAGEMIRRGAVDFVWREQLSGLVPAVARAAREAGEREQRRRAEVLLELRYQQLHLQNEALQQSEERFRQLAESIREVFWMTDVETGRMLYVSPAYEEIWGRSCASLYDSPLDWLEAVHEEDRARVHQAALHRQTTGSFNEQYRIVRPEGAVRWIHDRAFPVRDETGAVYRITGVAEDVTSRKHLERQVLEISDREQERIGRDLHDGLCQLLVSIGFIANALKKDLENQAQAGASSAERIGQRISQAIKMARHLARGLCPVDFRSENLATALRHLAQETTANYGVPCVAECEGAAPLTDPAVATHLYRIAQEAVHNAVKHGKPAQVLIELAAKNGRARLNITDDGCGLPAEPGPGAGMGLEIMRYRASVLCGTLEVRALEASEGHGTTVSCTFPGQAFEVSHPQPSPP